MQRIFLTILLFFSLMGSALPSNHVSNVTRTSKTPTSDYFIYYGISAMITEEMASFTQKYEVAFRNAGCMILNKTETEIHNQNVAQKLSLALGHDDWMNELPMKIMGIE